MIAGQTNISITVMTVSRLNKTTCHIEHSYRKSRHASRTINHAHGRRNKHMCRRELLYIARNYPIVANVGNLKQTTHLLLSTTKAPKTLPSLNHRKHTTDIEVETEIFAC